MSEPDEWRIAWSDAVKTPSSVVAHADDRFTFERHLLDWMRTRIEPGADPRQRWASQADELNALTTRAVFQLTTFAGETVALIMDRETIISWGWPPWRVLFVPEDVRRWRDRDHRAALIARARAHAAIIPGNRATMEVER